MLASPDLLRLLVVYGAWVTTDWALLVTVSLLALQLDGPAAVGLVGVVRVLPAAVLTGPLSVLTDRWSRSGVLTVVNAGWAVLAGLLAWCTLAGAPLPVLLVLVGVGAALGAVLKPALQAVLPTLVTTPAQLITANSAYATVEGLGTVLGPVVSGACLALVGPGGVFLVVTGLFVVAALASATMHTPFQPPQRAPGGHDLLAPFRGFGVLFGRDVRVTSALVMAQTTMRGLLTVFVVLVAASLPGDREALTSAAFAAMGLGGLLGPGLAMGLASSRHGARWMGVGITLWGLPVAVLGLHTAPSTALVMLFVVGLGNALLDVFGYSLLNRMFPDHLAGRAWGAFHAGAAGAVALGSLLAPLLASAMGLTGAMVLTGSLLALAPWAAWPWFRRVDDRARGREEDLALLRGLPVLAPMSTIGIERLSREAVPVAVPAGEAVVRQGEPADAWYVVVDGTLVVHRDGAEVRALGTGDAFGEIGLLDRAPRTASVHATSEVHLLRVDGAGFVAAVTGHRPSGESVRGAVASYRRDDALRTR